LTIVRTGAQMRTDKLVHIFVIIDSERRIKQTNVESKKNVLCCDGNFFWTEGMVRIYVGHFSSLDTLGTRWFLWSPLVPGVPISST
jgi:hypothetical protein